MALLAGCCLFLLVVYFVFDRELVYGLNLDHSIPIIVVLITCTLGYYSKSFLSRYMSGDKGGNSTEQSYIIHIVQYAIVEFGILFATIFFMLNDDIYSLISALLGIMVFYLLKPKS